MIRIIQSQIGLVANLMIYIKPGIIDPQLLSEPLLECRYFTA